jgi:transcriptional regulator with XRE-family HTH domain
MKISPLRLLRLAAGYSQNEMGRLLDIHPSLVSRYEHNRRKIPKDIRKKFVALCSSRIDWPAFLLLADARRSSD